MADGGADFSQQLCAIDGGGPWLDFRKFQRSPLSFGVGGFGLLDGLFDGRNRHVKLFSGSPNLSRSLNWVKEDQTRNPRVDRPFVVVCKRKRI